jgi:stage V sporulation protein B
MGNAWLQGTIILAAAALVARVLGVVQRIPLQRILDDTGMASYAMAYNVYFWLLVLATAGIPSALAKLVAHHEALGQEAHVARIRQVALRWAWIGGVMMAGGLYLLAPSLARWAGYPEAQWAMQALAPALFVFPWVAVQRGYFQGRQRMLPSGLSQVGEQVLRVGSSIFLAYVLVAAGYGVAWGAAGASAGGVFGALGAALVLLCAKHRKATPNRAPVLKPLLTLAVPTSVAALLVPTLYVIDTMATIPMLTPLLGVEEATRTMGVLGGRAQSLAGIPVLFAIALSQSLIPAVATAHAQQQALAPLVAKAVRWSVLLSVPIMLWLIYAVDAFNTILFGNAYGSDIIVAVVCTALPQVLMMTTASILLGIGKPHWTMVHMGIGLIGKVAFTMMLTPHFGVYGIVGGTAACFTIVMTLHFIRIRHLLSQHIFMLPLLTMTTAITAHFLTEQIHAPPLLHIVIVGTIVFLIWIICAVGTRTLTKEDIVRIVRIQKKPPQ